MHAPAQFFGFVDDTGKFAPLSKRLVKAVFEMFKGQDVCVSVQRRDKQRSAEQNAWLWGFALPAIAEHCGYDEHEHERLHYDLLSVRFGTTAVAPLVDGAPPRIVPTRTSSQLSIKEFSDYMEWLVRYAADKFNVTLTLPSERADAPKGKR